MRKLTLIALTLLMALSASAQRKTWDFTKGFSATTIAALQADADAQKTWFDSGIRFVNQYAKINGTACTYDADGNATPIPELEGLNFQNFGTSKLAIYYNSGQSENSTSPNGYYSYGKSFLWFNGKNLKVTLKSPASTTIKLGIESHKSTEGRGFEVYVGGQQLTPTSGSTTPTVFNEVTWDLPEATDGTDSLTVTVQSNNGAHLYYIIIGDGDAPEVDEAKKLAFIYSPADGYDPAGDIANAYISGGTYNVTNLSASDAISLDSLQKFDAIVIGNNMAADAALVPMLKSAIAYEPIVNLNSKLYAAWGLGAEVAGTGSDITISKPTATLFQNWDGFDTEATTLNLLTEGNVNGVSLGEYFSSDDVLATIGEAVAIHQHNPQRNTYIFLPLSSDLNVANQDNLSPLLMAAVKTAADTKVAVAKTTTPTITETYRNRETEVTISARAGATIHYTTDGTDPTQQSTVYTEPLLFTTPVTVKAIAFLDGYLVSDVAQKTITIKVQAQTPVVSVAQETGKSTVTLSQADGISVYYNFIGSTVENESQLYSEPIELTEKATITAFAAGGDFVQSEPASQLIEIQGQTVDNNRDSVLTHFSANNASDAFGVYPTSSPYLFSWGKSARSMYSDPEAMTLADPEQIVYGGWKIKSFGQVVTVETTTPGTKVGDGSGYNPATAFDAIPQADSIVITKNVANLKGKASGEPYNASIETTEPLQGPFDVVVFAYNGAGTEQDFLVSTSTDTLSWTQLADTVQFNVAKRLYKKFRFNYEGSDKVYLKLAHTGGSASLMVADIYVLVHDNSVVTGIADINAKSHNTGKPAAYYSVNGARQSGLKRGVNIVKYSDGTVRKVIVR